MKKVSEEAAREIIVDLLYNSTYQDDSIGREIKAVLEGDHKTYKYVLITALLAKSTNEEIDALSLQAKDDSVGAYDARSLCHNVIVPFEREYLPNSLGGSNEPFLNKPARYPRLTTDNAVRKGKDMETLKSLISILSRIRTSRVAQKYLSSAVSNLEDIAATIAEKYELPIIDMEELSGPQVILDFVYKVTESALEGEVCPLVVAAIEHYYYGGSRIVK